MNHTVHADTYVSAHDGRLFKGDKLSPICSLGHLHLRHVTHCNQVIWNLDSKIEGSLQVGLVKTGESSSSVGRFELRAKHVGFLARLGIRRRSYGRDSRPISRSIEAAHEIVDCAGILDVQDGFLAGLELLGEGQCDTLSRKVITNIRRLFIWKQLLPRAYQRK